MRIVWIYGPRAVGKSTTGWAALQLLSASGERTAYVDIDQLGMSYPDPPEDEWRHRLKARALAAAAAEYAAHGAQTLVVSGVLDVELFEFYADVLADFPVHFARLRVGPPELRRRMGERGDDAEDWAGVAADARAHDEAGTAHPTFVSVGGSATDVAARILDGLVDGDGSPGGVGPSGPVSPRPAGGEAVLVTGVVGVGKSTVAFAAFLLSRAAGVPTAFLDLRQLGFLGPSGGPVDHRLQAATAGAVWRVFRDDGAERLVLTGPDADDQLLRRYALALDGTPLTGCRLVAAQAALRARLRARARGEGARLAGDLLAGLGEGDLEALVDAGVRRQAAPRQPSWLTVLDTTDLTADEAARGVLDRLRGVDMARSDG